MAIQWALGQIICLPADVASLPTNVPTNTQCWVPSTQETYRFEGTWIQTNPVGEASYQAYVAGSTYKVYNTLTRKVDYSGLNARTVLQPALTACAGTGKAMMLKSNMNFVLDGPLEMDHYMGLYGESWQGISQIRANGDFPAISIDSSTKTHGIVKVSLKNLYITHNSPTYPNDTGLVTIKSGVDAGTPRLVAGVRIEGCQIYDFARLRGAGLKIQCNNAAIYKIKVDNCEFYNLNDQIIADIPTNDTSNSWISQCSFISNNFWLPNNSACKLFSTTFNGGNNMPQFINSQWVDCNVQSGANNIGFDYETEFPGASWYNHWTNCMVWDLLPGKDAWKFGPICEASLVNCIPTYKIGGAGATNTKIRKFGIYDRAYGTYTANGTGAQTTFTVATLMGATGGTVTPLLKHVSITPLHADVQPTARTYTWASSDSSFFNVVFSTAPPSATGNVKFSWEAML